jgi:tRNA-splicing endonuclease subunit Sen34
MLVVAQTDSLHTELAVIIDDANSHPDAEIAHLHRWNAERLESMRQQIVLGEAKGAKEAATSGRAMTEAAIQKRREREQKRAQQSTNVSEAASSTESSSLFAPAPISEREPDPTILALSARESTRTGTYNITIPAPSSELPWYFPSSSVTYTTIASAKRAGVWTYPETLQERAKCGVFRGLWEQGFFMGGGIKFGGDYLVYPGSYHFIAMNSEFLNLSYGLFRKVIPFVITLILRRLLSSPPPPQSGRWK